MRVSRDTVFAARSHGAARLMLKQAFMPLWACYSVACRSAARTRRGVVALEFAIVSFALLLLLLGIVTFGIALDSYLQLTAAAGTGAQALALTRGAADPYSQALAAIDAAAGTLTAASITTTLSINGTACTAASCSVSAAGQVAQVTLAYPCNLTVMGINFVGNLCTLSTTSAALVQ